MQKEYTYHNTTIEKDFGPDCLKIIAKYHGKLLHLRHLKSAYIKTYESDIFLRLGSAAEQVGFRSLKAKIVISQLKETALPLVLLWKKRHFVVLVKIEKPNNTSIFHIHGNDGVKKYSEKEFWENWIGKDTETTKEGVVILLETTADFHTETSEKKGENLGFTFMAKYILRYKSFIKHLAIGLIFGNLIQLLFPFLTQGIVDLGIKNQDIHFVYLILFAQLFLFIGSTSVQVIRSWILLHLSARINISLISDFFMKLMRLSVAFFDASMTGDIMQRINDHERIKSLVTSSSLNVLFSLTSIIVFGFVLVYHNLYVFLIFIIGSILYFLWIKAFLKKRAELDEKRFFEVSQSQNKVIEILNGMQDIKLQNAERQKRWAIEHIQARLFRITSDQLKLEQYQTVGADFINELKNMLITILAAKLVVDNLITLGAMLAITYIIGQLNAPLSQLGSFIREFQDAKISLDRIWKIHKMENEEDSFEEKTGHLQANSDIVLNKVSFTYPKSEKTTIRELSLKIHANKITAIVGGSGSGKTTLLKLILKFYQPSSGKILLASQDLKNISQKLWRSNTGVVMQEGFIFNDTIAFNIAVGESEIDMEKFKNAIFVANIVEFVERLPLTYNTKIGREGMSLSTGQKQRILIARAVYKNPKYLFFDEASSALDANNEKIIMERLNTFFQNKTVVVIAHRLSTVRNAHQIVVMDQGQITEIGHHEALVSKKGAYYNLVKNQLELGD